MTRKTVITITGDDDKDEVNVSMNFEPSLDVKDEPPPSGWSTATSKAMEFVQSLAGNE